MTSLAMSDYVNSPLHVRHAISSLQLRINSAKHMDAGIATLNSTYFHTKFDEIRVVMDGYIATPSREEAEKLIGLCEALQKML